MGLQEKYRQLHPCFFKPVWRFSVLHHFEREKTKPRIRLEDYFITVSMKNHKVQEARAGCLPLPQSLSVCWPASRLGGLWSEWAPPPRVASPAIRIRRSHCGRARSSSMDSVTGWGPIQAVLRLGPTVAGTVCRQPQWVKKMNGSSERKRFVFQPADRVSKNVTCSKLSPRCPNCAEWAQVMSVHRFNSETWRPWRANGVWCERGLRLCPNSPPTP